MELLNLCHDLTSKEVDTLPENHKMGRRLVCPEYSKSAIEVKTYPLLSEEKLFALCWHMTGDGTLYSTMYPTPKAFSYAFHLDSEMKTQLHTHDYIELTYVVSGSFKQRILDKDITFSEGDLCLIDKNGLHQDYLIDEPATILFIGIANDIFSEIMDENIATEKIISFLQSALLKQKDVQQYLHFKPNGSDHGREDLEKCLTMLLRELTINQTGSNYIRKGLLLRIFRILSTKYDFALSKDQRKAMNWLMFDEVSSYMRYNYATVTIQELQTMFHFQEDYFNRLIKKNTGLTYSAYLREIRLTKAEQMLLSTDKSIEEIADYVGYQNRGFFYKIFEEKHHMTPALYRKKDK